MLGLKGDFADVWHYDVYAQRGTVDNSNGNLTTSQRANVRMR